MAVILHCVVEEGVCLVVSFLYESVIESITIDDLKRINTNYWRELILTAVIFFFFLAVQELMRFGQSI